MTSALDPFLSVTRIAYLSMEIAIRPEMHTYAGGLGMLAGDTARSCAELELPIVLVTLASRAGLLNHHMRLAKLMVAGSDVWLNTPLPPMEASGTSGMKAALNAVLNLSVLDGWWLEACIEGMTGWAIGDNAGVKPARAAWGGSLRQDRGGGTAALLQRPGSVAPDDEAGDSQRTMRRYASEAYLR